MVKAANEFKFLKLYKEMMLKLEDSATPGACVHANTPHWVLCTQVILQAEHLAKVVPGLCTLGTMRSIFSSYRANSAG